jgi:perosamine synthetase
VIPYFRLAKPLTEQEAVLRICSSGAWAVGEDIELARQELMRIFKKPYVVLTANGYSALFISIKSLGIFNQAIILPAIGTCFAISNAIIASGNIPVFCDVNLEDGNCDKESVKRLVETQSIQYIISPNYAGNLSDTSYFKDDLNLTVIEDACQSFFSSIYGSSNQADVQVFSFYPTKGINGMDGGAIVTEDIKIFEAAKSMVYYDEQVSYDTREHFNFRFLNVNAAVLNSNLKRISFVAEKNKSIENKYAEIVNGSNAVAHLKNKSSYVNHRFVLKFETSAQLELAASIFRKNDISFTPFFDWCCDSSEINDFPNAQRLLSSSYCIPFFEDLTEAEIDLITKTLSHVVEESK